MRWLSPLVFLAAFAVASCVPGERVPEWLTTELRGVPGLAGYHYRLQRAELNCRVLPDAPEAHLTVVLAYYVDLPRGLGMVEYPAHPADLLPLEAAGPREVPEQTVLFLADLSRPEARQAAERILSTGEVEIVLLAPELEVPDAIARLLPRAQMVFRYNPGLTPGMLARGNAVLDLGRLALMKGYFIGRK